MAVAGAGAIKLSARFLSSTSVFTRRLLLQLSPGDAVSSRFTPTRCWANGCGDSSSTPAIGVGSEEKAKKKIYSRRIDEETSKKLETPATVFWDTISSSLPKVR